MAFLLPLKSRPPNALIFVFSFAHKPIEANEMSLPPYNSDAERSVLGAMILSDESIGDAIEYLEAEYFYETSHQKIFEGIKTIYSERKNVDLVVLSNYLKKEGIKHEWNENKG